MATSGQIIMAGREKIIYEEFIQAAITVAVVVADAFWRRFRDEMTSIHRPASDSPWLDSKAARRHVCFGETKFRQLIKEGVLPAGRKVRGKLISDKQELDRRMATQVRGRTRTRNRIH
jgi:hypothetical protein